MPRAQPRSKPKPKPKSRTRPASKRRASAAPEDWLTGFHSVREALRAGRRRLDELWIRSGKLRAEHVELANLAQAAGVPIVEVADAEIDQRAGGEGNAQGIALRAGPIPELSLAALLEQMGGEAPLGNRVVALDGVEDPQNVGAVARVAESAGVRGMILTQRRAPGLTPAVSRASAGAIEWLPVARVANLGRALSELQAQTFWVVAAALESSQPLFSLEDRILRGNLVVVLGAEGRGIRRSILDQADHLVEIPMRGKIASLNVSTAGAIILYDLLRRAEVDPGLPSG